MVRRRRIGLPPDLLAIVAEAGGLNAMQNMRRVSKVWQQGFDLTVSSLRIPLEAPVLPPHGPALRFPSLTHLDLGESSTLKSTLANLRDFSKLTSLVLGRLSGPTPAESLHARMSDHAMAYLRGLPLRSLVLARCRSITSLGLGYLQVGFLLGFRGMAD